MEKLPIDGGKAVKLGAVDDRFIVEGEERFLIDGKEYLVNNAEHIIIGGKEYLSIENRLILIDSGEVHETATVEDNNTQPRSDEEDLEDDEKDVKEKRVPPYSAIFIVILLAAGCLYLSIPFLQSFTDSPDDYTSISQAAASSNALPTTQIPTSTPARSTTTSSSEEQKIAILKKIVEDYHQKHTYSLPDLFVCSDMSIDVWNLVETQGINSVIEIGNVDERVNSINDANHAWVLAEVSPNNWIALETTGGFLVCRDTSVCPVFNELYYQGWRFDNPREFKETLDKLEHPCSDGYVLGSDDLCHLACGSGYCTGDSVCINGECRGCSPGYVLGQDLQCHLACGSGYCTGDSVCINGECRGCSSGYVLGQDLQCHLACGSGYCTGDSVCINGECRGCSPGYVLGEDLKCYPECPVGSGRYCLTGVCGSDGLCHMW